MHFSTFSKIISTVAFVLQVQGAPAMTTPNRVSHDNEVDRLESNTYWHKEDSVPYGDNEVDRLESHTYWHKDDVVARGDNEVDRLESNTYWHKD